MKKAVSAFVFAIITLALLPACGKGKNCNPCSKNAQENEHVKTTIKSEKEDYSI